MGFPEPPPPPTTDPTASSGALAVPLSVRLGSLLAWLGVCICFLLLQGETALRSWLCPVRGGCETVLASRYSNLRGLPLPWLGVAFYLMLLGLWLSVSASASLRLRLRVLDSVVWCALAGTTFSAGLTYLQLATLHAICPLCLASALTVAALLLTALWAKRAVASGHAGASPAGAVTLALFAVLPALILAAGNFAEKGTAKGLWLVDLSTAHRVGPVDAPVQIVVYSDFQCEFCRKLVPVLQEIRGEFPQEVAIVYRHFPLAVHPRAFAAAVASECAAEQGAFWQYHDQLFAQGGDLGDAKLLELASSLGLDRERFSACLQSDRPRRVVEGNLREAAQLWLPGAPSVFVNGRRVEGAPTRDALAKRIKELLQTQSRGFPH
jgi:protein-disulfide isomerase